MNLLIWGFLFTIFDITIEGFDLLADSVGWIMIFIALQRFPVNDFLRYAKVGVIVLTIISLPGVGVNSELNELFRNPYHIMNFIMPGLSQMLLMFVGVNLLTGFHHLLNTNQQYDFDLIAFKNPFAFVQLLTAFSYPLLIILGDTGIFIGFAASILSLLFTIVLLFKLNKVKLYLVQSY